MDIRQEVPSEHERTIRTKIMDWARDTLREAQFIEGTVLGPDTPLLFDFVDYGTLEDIAPRETPGAMLQEGEEEVQEGVFGKTTKVLRMYVHFKIINVQGVDQEPLINYYFGRIAKTLVMPEDFANVNAMDVREVGNAIQANGKNDPEPGGTIYFDIDYRHTYGNPFAE